MKLTNIMALSEFGIMMILVFSSNPNDLVSLRYTAFGLAFIILVSSVIRLAYSKSLKRIDVYLTKEGDGQ